MGQTETGPPVYIIYQHTFTMAMSTLHIEVDNFCFVHKQVMKMSLYVVLFEYWPSILVFNNFVWCYWAIELKCIILNFVTWNNIKMTRYPYNSVCLQHNTHNHAQYQQSTTSINYNGTHRNRTTCVYHLLYNPLFIRKHLQLQWAPHMLIISTTEVVHILNILIYMLFILTNILTLTA